MCTENINLKFSVRILSNFMISSVSILPSVFLYYSYNAGLKSRDRDQPIEGLTLGA